MKTKIIYLLLVSFFSAATCISSFAQNIHLSKANDYYNHLSYSEAITEYEAALKKNPELVKAKINLADCYRLTGSSEKAEYWYQQVTQSPDAEQIHKYYYGQSLLNNKKYELAKSWFNKYNIEFPNDQRGSLALKSIENLPVYFKDSASYKLSKLSINSENGDFCPVLYNDGIVFTSSRDNNKISQHTHEWTGQPFLSLYYATGKANAFKEITPFDLHLQIKYNDGPVSFNQKGDEIYITRNNIDKARSLIKKNQAINLQIFHAKKENDTWREIDDFKYNSNEYNCGHTALSPDGSRLYFASDMPGGSGGMDLYVCEKDSSGWAKPVNLGSRINTPGNELFPYLHDDGTFIFSSNGRDGLGGLDVYSCTMKAGNIIDEPKNMGAPINSSEDDFGVIYDNKTHMGYLSTNRDYKNANDEIYSFTRILKLTGIVVKKGTDIPIAGSTVTLKTKDFIEGETLSKEDGTFEMTIKQGNDYIVEASKEEYSIDVKSFSTHEAFPKENYHVKLELNHNPKKTYKLIVHVIDKTTRAPIMDATIGLDQTEQTLGYTDSKGTWSQELKPNSSIHLIVTKDGYQPKVIYMSNEGQTKEKDYEFIVELLKGEDIGPYARWYKIIYFDFDKSNIRSPDADKTMEEVLAFVNAHSEVRLLMNSYCDARGTAAYNMKLSKKRAQGATDWLVKRGMESKMVEKMEWGGESMLINKCSDGSLCSEEDHQLNRRTEIRVIRIQKGLSMKK